MRINKLKAIITSSTATDTYVVIFGKLLIAMFGLLYTTIITRRLSVSEFGTFSALENFVQMTVVFSDLGMSTGIISFLSSGDKKNKTKYISAYLMGKVLLLIPVLGFASIFANYSLPNSIKWLLIMGIGYSLWQFYTSVLNGSKNFKKAVIVDISMAVSRIVFLIFIIIFSKNIINSGAIFTSYSIGLVVAIWVGSIYVKISRINFQNLLPNIKKIIQFSGSIGVYKLISSLADKVDIQAISYYQDSSEVGYYAIGLKLATFIATIALGYSLTLSTRLASFDKKKIGSLYKYLVKSLYAISPLMVLILAFTWVSPWLVVKAFGSPYLNSIGVLKILTISKATLLIEAPLVAFCIFAINKKKYLITSQVIRLIVVVVGNYIVSTNPSAINTAYISLLGGVSAFISLSYLVMSYKRKMMLE